MMGIIMPLAPGKVCSRVGSAEEALVVIRGTGRPTAMACSARSATIRFTKARQAAMDRFRSLTEGQQSANCSPFRVKYRNRSLSLQKWVLTRLL